MIFPLLTLLSALMLAAVAGWFSIIGFMTIYAGAPIYALTMGVVAESAKLVTVSWLYRNWEHSSWKLKIPLLYFVAALMIITSIGVFGFLSKAHLEQTSGTLDNSAKIENIVYRIDREKAIIADNETVIAQLDATVSSFLGKDRIDRSLSVRRSQAPQRKQLRDEIAASQIRIDELTSEKFKLESEIRALELEVGPIRYIAELIYGVNADSTANIEAAVRLFTLLLVSTLDPLAIVLLIAANHSLLRLANNKKSYVPQEHTITDHVDPPDTQDDIKQESPAEFPPLVDEVTPSPEQPDSVQQLQPSFSEKKTKQEPVTPIEDDVHVNIRPEVLSNFFPSMPIATQPIARSPTPTLTRVLREKIDINTTDKPNTSAPWAHQETVLRELLGSKYSTAHKRTELPESPPRGLSWVNEFKRT